MVVSGAGSVQNLGHSGGQGCGPSIRFIVGASDTGGVGNYRHVVCCAVTWFGARLAEVLRAEGLRAPHCSGLVCPEGGAR